MDLSGEIVGALRPSYSQLEAGTGPVGSSRIWTQDLENLRASGRRSNQLSYILLLNAGMFFMRGRVGLLGIENPYYPLP